MELRTVTKPRHLLRVSQAVACAFLVAFALHTLFWHGNALDSFFDDWVYNALVVVAAVSCLSRAAFVRAQRAAWLLLGIGLALWSAAELTSTIYLSTLDDPPYPSIADALWLAFYPASCAALVMLVRDRLGSRRPTMLWIDGLVAAFAVAALGEVIVFRPVIDATGAGSAIQIATDLAYPFFDLVLVAVVVGVFAMTGWRPGRSWTLIGLGLVAAVAADSIYAYQSSHGTYMEGTVLDALWPAATLLVGYAAWEPAARPGPPRQSGWWVMVLPAGFALTALGLLVYDHFKHIDHVALVLATLTLITVIVRTALTFRENLRMLAYSRREAMTDALTGLGNRRRLMMDLLRQLDEATHERPRLLVLFDLDGFKRYNDDFGHPAGDSLLARLGRNLSVAVSGWGRAYRLGGDEFCVLGEPRREEVERAVAVATAALTEHGRGFEVTASHGIVLLPDEAPDPSTALQIADQRLYGNKGARRRSAVGQQTRDVLLQVLQEREPALHKAMHAVATLAVAVGEEMALLPEELDEMARAAELHDVGKMAVPEEILNKPGPLDHVELGFIRQHTIVGERILGAAPSLSPVARLVRASHERWDGSGYPDGLAGHEIPLAARIIAACDAFHAMTTERPYRVAVSVDEAVAELRRCAGTHFDPAVVEVLCAKIAEVEAAADLGDPTPLEPTIDVESAFRSDAAEAEQPADWQ